MTIFAPFELSRGTWVSHDTTLRPKHQKSDWDVRCKACKLAKAYVGQLSNNEAKEASRP